MSAPRPKRSAGLAKLHIARKDLGLDEESYRAILKRVVQRDSAAGLSDAQLGRVLDEFRRLGWKPGGRPISPDPLIRKIYRIWKDIRPLLDDAGDEALRGFVQRQTRTRINPTGISAPEFLGTEDATRVIEGLKGWLARLRAKAVGEAA